MEKITKLLAGTCRLINAENNDYEAWAKSALEHFGCDLCEPYDNYLTKLISDGEQLTGYKFMLVGKQLFQIGNVNEYTTSGLVMMAPGEKNGYFTFVTGTHENEDPYELLNAYIKEMFDEVKTHINTNDLIQKWISESPEDAQNALTSLYERMKLINGNEE